MIITKDMIRFIVPIEEVLPIQKTTFADPAILFSNSTKKFLARLFINQDRL